MTKFGKQITAGILALGTIVGSTGAGLSSTFFGWKVSGVAAGDLLNVRAYPSSKSKVLVGYPNGMALSLTGRCTGGLHLDEISGKSSWQQRQAVRTNWCEAWLDPDGDGEYRNGWVYGRYIRPL